jgi:hypothetical protein
MRTVPVKYSTGPLLDGCEPIRLMSISGLGIVRLVDLGWRKDGGFAAALLSESCTGDRDLGVKTPAVYCR